MSYEPASSSDHRAIGATTVSKSKQRRAVAREPFRLLCALPRDVLLHLLALEPRLPIECRPVSQTLREHCAAATPFCFARCPAAPLGIFTEVQRLCLYARAHALVEGQITGGEALMAALRACETGSGFPRLCGPDPLGLCVDWVGSKSLLTALGLAWLQLSAMRTQGYVSGISRLFKSLGRNFEARCG